MRFAFVLTQLEAGGAQVRVMQTAKELRARGHDVDVCFLYERRPAFEGEPKVILGPSGDFAGIAHAAWALRSRLAKGKYDALITNTAPANIIGQTLGAGLGLKRRIAVQTQPPARLKRLYRALDWFCGCAGIYRINIANSKWTLACFDRYPRAYRQRLHMVPDGVEPRKCNRSVARARAHFNLPADRPVLLNIGRLSHQKGQDVLFKALVEIPDALLVIAGDGELRARHQADIEGLGLKDRVRLLGEVSGDEVATMLRAADLFVFPSRWETFGLAVVEAAMSGLPVVASDLPVLNEVLETQDGGQAAMMVPPDDPAAWVRAVRAVLGESELADTLRRQSLKLAGRYSIETHVDNLLATLDRL